MSDEPKKPTLSLIETELTASIRYLIDSEGNKTAVLIDIAVWEQLLTALKRDQHIREALLAQVRESRQIYKIGQASTALDELLDQFVEEGIYSESQLVPETMLLSEPVLSRDWNSPEEDEAWANL